MEIREYNVSSWLTRIQGIVFFLDKKKVHRCSDDGPLLKKTTLTTNKR